MSFGNDFCFIKHQFGLDHLSDEEAEKEMKKQFEEWEKKQ